MIPDRLNWLDRGINRRLAEILNRAGFEVYLVGGSVRDALLSREASDFDYATNARPDQMKPLFRDWADHLFTTGERFGTIGLIKEGTECQITTFRAEIYEPESRHPSVTFGDSIESDLERRDFTINAIALRLGHETPHLVDPFNGVADLAAGVIKTPAGPDLSFSDDPLRMVRLFRFMAELGFRPAKAELEAVTRLKKRLGTISQERIRDEFSKLVVAENPVPALLAVIESGLSAEFIPEIDGLAMIEDPFHRHKDVLAHSLAVLAKTEPDLVLRLAALFHDVGKPATRRFEGSKVTFYHHEVIGARMTRRRLKKLRYPKKIVNDVAELVFLHMRAHTFKMGWTDSAVRRYVRDAGHLLNRLNQLARCDVTTRNDQRARRIQRHLDELEERIEALRAQEELDAIRPPLNGNEVMDYLNLDPGPMVGTVLKMLLDRRIEQGPFNRVEAYSDLRDWAIAQGLPDPGDPPPEDAETAGPENG
ncbi:MAG: CCA tRNA nucleotidyltransferase [Acidimicrobiia bacterium]|nr:CCA tRNA nucleotidyltransferase [Acidimicrobiia bacterium]